MRSYDTENTSIRDFHYREGYLVIATERALTNPNLNMTYVENIHLIENSLRHPLKRNRKIFLATSEEGNGDDIKNYFRQRVSELSTSSNRKLLTRAKRIEDNLFVSIISDWVSKPVYHLASIGSSMYKDEKYVVIYDSNCLINKCSFSEMHKQILGKMENDDSIRGMVFSLWTHRLMESHLELSGNGQEIAGISRKGHRSRRLPAIYVCRSEDFVRLRDERCDDIRRKAIPGGRAMEKLLSEMLELKGGKTLNIKPGYVFAYIENTDDMTFYRHIKQFD